MASGFISFPIFTRIFSKEQYGLFSLIGVTVSLLTPLSALGANRAVLRFYEKYKQQQSLPIVFSTLLISIVIFGGLISFIALAGCKILSFYCVSAKYAFLPFGLALIWMIFQNLFNLLNMTYRMEEKIVAYNINGILRKYGGMLIAVCLVLLFSNLTSYYAGVLIAECLLVVILLFFLFKQIKPFAFIRKMFSKEIFVVFARYGVPLALSAIPIVLFNSGDRYIIAAFMTSKDVAIYSVGYNLCNYAKELIVSPLNLALVPVVFKLWENKKTDELNGLLISTIRYFLMFAIPICFISILVSFDLIVVLASDKYKESAQVVPVVLAGVFLHGLDFPFSVGLHLVRKTGVFLYVMGTAALLNIGLNIFAVPKFGIMGAAYTTLVSYIFYISVFYFISRRHYKVQLPCKGVIHHFMLGAICFFVVDYYVSFFGASNSVLNIINISMSYLALYVILLCLTDGAVRRYAQKSWRFITKRLANIS
jgi:O-antigen/teichoic acid export membrane protein